MKIIYKFTLGFLLVSLLVGAVAYSGLNATDSINNAYSAVENETIPTIETLEDLRYAGMRIVASTHESVSILAGNRTGGPLLEGEYGRIKSGIELYNNSLKRYEDLVNKFFPEEKELLDNITITGQRLQKTSSDLIDLKTRGVSESKVQGKYEEFEEAESNFLKAVDDALAREDTEFAERMDNLHSSIENTKKIILSVSLFTFIAAITGGIYLSSRFSKPILELKNAAIEIGKGKLGTRVDIKSKDEVGILATCFNQMAERLEQDITERKRVETALRESEEKFRSITAAAMDAIVSMDDEGRIYYLNPAGERIFGYTAEEAMGRELHTFFVPEKHHDAFKKGFEEFKATGKGRLIGKITEVSALRKDGTEFPVEVSVSALRIREGWHAVGIIRDITERKKTEELRLENERIAYANRAKSEFLEFMSHELRTPLNAVLGFSELVKQTTELNEKQRHYLENIITSGKSLLGIIDRILDLTMTEAEKPELVIEKFDAVKALNEIIALIKEKAVNKNVTLKKEFDPQLEFIKADRIKFNQILFNLIDNAVKFSKKEGGTVTIATRKVDDMAQISVSDTGIGIKEEDMSKLFTKFWQADSGIARKYSGTGLGLASTKQLVEMHGGKIWAKSKFGIGSTFTFVLPLKDKKEGIK